MGPEGFASQPYEGCPFGSLVAQLGLHWQKKLHCVGAGATVTAERDGILFLQANDGRFVDNAGRLEVTVTSTGAVAPVIPAAEISGYGLGRVQADWVELQGDHVRLTLPRALVAKHQATAVSALAAFDGWYAAQAALVGQAPYGGDLLRYFPDDSIPAQALMLSGNPVRFRTVALDGPPGKKCILRAHAPA